MDFLEAKDYNNSAKYIKEVLDITPVHVELKNLHT